MSAKTLPIFTVLIALVVTHFSAHSICQVVAATPAGDPLRANEPDATLAEANDGEVNDDNSVDEPAGDVPEEPDTVPSSPTPSTQAQDQSIISNGPPATGPMALIQQPIATTIPQPLCQPCAAQVGPGGVIYVVPRVAYNVSPNLIQPHGVAPYFVGYSVRGRPIWYVKGQPVRNAMRYFQP